MALFPSLFSWLHLQDHRVSLTQLEEIRQPWQVFRSMIVLDGAPNNSMSALVKPQKVTFGSNSQQLPFVVEVLKPAITRCDVSMFISLGNLPQMSCSWAHTGCRIQGHGATPSWNKGLIRVETKYWSTWSRWSNFNLLSGQVVVSIWDDDFIFRPTRWIITDYIINNGWNGRREMAAATTNGIEIGEYVSIINLNRIITQTSSPCISQEETDMFWPEGCRAAMRCPMPSWTGFND
jgi:hypothetical protein